MTAGIRNQPVAGTKVALAPAAIVGLLGATLFVGGLLGVATRAELDSISANPATAQVVASIAATRSSIERQAQIAVGRGPLVRDPGTAVRRQRNASKAVDHIGLTERLFPVTSAHRIEHGPLP